MNIICQKKYIFLAEYQTFVNFNALVIRSQEITLNALRYESDRIWITRDRLSNTTIQYRETRLRGVFGQ